MLKKSEKGIDNSWAVRYNGKAVLNAAIAQSVERILGKDEVASSNLASSSKKKPRTPTGFRLSSFLRYVAPSPKTDTETDTAVFYHTKLSYNSAPCCANTNRRILRGMYLP